MLSLGFSTYVFGLNVHKIDLLSGDCPNDSEQFTNLTQN